MYSACIDMTRRMVTGRTIETLMHAYQLCLFGTVMRLYAFNVHLDALRPGLELPGGGGVGGVEPLHLLIATPDLGSRNMAGGVEFEPAYLIFSTPHLTPPPRF